MTHNDDQLEQMPGQLPAIEDQAHVIAVHSHDHHNHGQGDYEQYELHEEHVPLLPGKILTDTIARVRYIIVLVSFFYSGLIFIVCILAVCLIAPNILYWMDQNSPILIDTARVIISLISLALGGFCIVVAFKQRELTANLATAELMIDSIRDLALIQMQATRYNLEDLTERLKFPKEPGHATPFDYIELAKKIGPVISLLMAKERSVMTIAVEGLKLFQVLKKVLNK